MASLLQVAHLASLLQVVAPLASLLQVVLVQPLGLLALQQGVRLERLKRVDSGAALVAAAPLAPSPPLRLLDLELQQGVGLALRPRGASVQRRGGSGSRRLAVRSAQQRVGHLGRRGVGLVRRKLVDSGAALVAAAPLLLELRPGVRLVPLQPEALVRRSLVPLRLCRSFSPWAQPEALLEDKEKRRPCRAEAEEEDDDVSEEEEEKEEEGGMRWWRKGKSDE